MPFTCPRCGAVSHHPMDERQGYCGRCHDWTSADPAPRTKPCEVCGGNGYVPFNYGHTINPDGSLGGRGMRSIPCHACGPDAS